MTASDPEGRVARVVAILATVGFALAASWELFGPFLAGHYASSASVGIIADNMLRWHIPGPVWEYTSKRPTPDAYYCHHPWGIFFTTALFRAILGRHDFVIRLAPVLLSTATPPLLYDLGKTIWRPAAGAAAAVAFVVLPISLAFANFNALEVPVIAWSTLFLWGYVKATTKGPKAGQRRYLAASLFGLFMALESDWPAYLLAAAVLAFAFARSLFLRRFFGPLGPRHSGVSEAARERRFAAFWLGATAILVATLATDLFAFHASGKLGDLFGSAEMRSAGNAAPLSRVLESRRYWIELCFTPIAILLGKVGAVVSLARLFVFRREHEFLPLAVLFMAVVQYVAFKQGADIHVFWPHHFALYFALAMGAIVASLSDAAEGALSLLGRPARAGRAGAIALGVALVPLAFVLRDGLPALVYARETGGRFNEKGLLIDSDGDKTAFVDWLAPKLRPSAVVEMHESMRATWSLVWNLGGRVVEQNRPLPLDLPKGGGVYLADSRFLFDDAAAALASRFHVVAVGPFWAMGAGLGEGPLEAFAIDEREPSLFRRYFVSGTEPARTIRPDPYRTWELREHYGQSSEAPTTPPVTLEERRIAHNIAVSRGDDARAAELLSGIVHELTPLDGRYDDGSTIFGSTFHEGAESMLTLYVLAKGPSKNEVEITVRSKVLSPARWSTTMADPTDREVGLPLAISPKRFRQGFVYAVPVPIRKRPGHEVFRALYGSRSHGAAPRRVGAKEDLVVLDLD